MSKHFGVVYVEFMIDLQVLMIFRMSFAIECEHRLMELRLRFCLSWLVGIFEFT